MLSKLSTMLMIAPKHHQLVDLCQHNSQGCRLRQPQQFVQHFDLHQFAPHFTAQNYTIANTRDQNYQLNMNQPFEQDEKGLFTFYYEQEQQENELKAQRKKRKAEMQAKREEKVKQQAQEQRQTTKMAQEAAKKQGNERDQKPQENSEQSKRVKGMARQHRKAKSGRLDLSQQSPVLAYFRQHFKVGQTQSHSSLENMSTQERQHQVSGLFPPQKPVKINKIALEPTNFCSQKVWEQSNARLAHKFHKVPISIFNSLEFKSGKSKEYILNQVLKSDRRNSMMASAPKKSMLPKIQNRSNSEMLAKPSKVVQEAEPKGYAPQKKERQPPKRVPKVVRLKQVDEVDLRVLSQKKELESSRNKREDNEIYSIFVRGGSELQTRQEVRKQGLLRDILKQLRFE